VREQGGGAAGLRARTLFHQEEFPAGVVGPRLVQVDDDLEREDEVAVEVAVQGVPVPGPVAEEDRGRPGLARVVAHSQPFVERVRPWGAAAEPGVPVAGDRQRAGALSLVPLLFIAPPPD
jgi:hypothetical protein